MNLKIYIESLYSIIMLLICLSESDHCLITLDTSLALSANRNRGTLPDCCEYLLHPRFLALFSLIPITGEYRRQLRC